MRKFVIFRGKCMTSLKVVLQAMEFVTASLHSSFFLLPSEHEKPTTASLEGEQKKNEE